MAPARNHYRVQRESYSVMATKTRVPRKVERMTKALRALLSLVKASEKALENVRELYRDDTPEVRKLTVAIRKARKQLQKSA